MESTHPILNPNDIIDPTSTPLGEILDPDILKDKIDLIDVHGLTASTRTLLQEALDDPRVQWGGSWLNELDSLLGKTKEEFMADDHRILMEVFRILTVSIVLLHTMELARFRFEGEHRSTVVKGVELFRRKEAVSSREDGTGNLIRRWEPRDAQGPTDGSRRDHGNPVPQYGPAGHIDTVRVIFNKEGGVQRDPIDVDIVNRCTLSGFLSTRSPLQYGSPSNHTLSWKMTMELLGLDDYGIDSLRAFAKSQHDWVISSIDDFTSFKDQAGELLMASLLYGCDPHGGIKRLKRQDDGMSNKVERFVRDVRCNLTFNKSTWYDNLRLSRSLLPNKSSFGVHRLYPYELLMYQRGDYPTEQEMHDSIDLISAMMTLNFTERDRQWLSKMDEIYRRSFLMSSYLHVLGDDLSDDATRTQRSRAIWGEGATRVLSGDRRTAWALSIPEDLAREITKRRILDIERRTGFIKQYLIDATLGGQIFRELDAALGNATGRPIDPLRINALIQQDMLDLNLHELLAPFMVKCPDPSVVVPTGSYSPDDAGSMDTDERRFNAFAKIYAVHQMVRFHEAIPGDGPSVELDPLDMLIMTDVMDETRRAYIEGVIPLVGEINAYESLTDGCDALIRRSNELLAMRRNLIDGGRSAAPDKILAGSDAGSDAGLPVVCDHGEIIAANDVAVMYDLMLHDGDAKRIDDAMQRLDDAMIDIIINHYIERLSGSSIGAEAEDGDSMMDDLPAGFRLESLKMDVLNRYEDALTGDDPSAWQSSRGLQ